MRLLTVFLLILSAFANGCSPSENYTAARNTETQGVEGVVNGGGGKGILCSRQLSILDIYEARQEGLPVPKPIGNLTLELRKYALVFNDHFSDEKIDNTQAELIARWLDEEVAKKFKPIEFGKRLPLTNDATIPKLNAGCKVVQIAIWDSKNVIHLDQEYWNMLSSLDQAALLFHEWIYARARGYGSLNSDETRAVVGHLISEKISLSIVPDKSGLYWCGAGIEGKTQIFEFNPVDELRNGIKGTALYFRGFSDIYVTSRTSAFYPEISVEEFTKKHSLDKTLLLKNELTNKEWVLEISHNSENGIFKIRSFDKDTETKPEFSDAFCDLKSN